MLDLLQLHGCHTDRLFDLFFFLVGLREMPACYDVACFDLFDAIVVAMPPKLGAAQTAPSSDDLQQDASMRMIALELPRNAWEKMRGIG